MCPSPSRVSSTAPGMWARICAPGGRWSRGRGSRRARRIGGALGLGVVGRAGPAGTGQRMQPTQPRPRLARPWVCGARTRPSSALAGGRRSPRKLSPSGGKSTQMTARPENGPSGGLCRKLGPWRTRSTSPCFEPGRSAPATRPGGPAERGTCLNSSRLDRLSRKPAAGDPLPRHGAPRHAGAGIGCWSARAASSSYTMRRHDRAAGSLRVCAHHEAKQ